MDSLTFVSTIIGHLAWPGMIFVIFLILFFRSDQLSKLVESVRYGDIEVVLRDKFSDAQKSADKLRPQVTASSNSVDDKFSQLAEVDPAAGVMHMWKAVETEIATSQDSTRAVKFMQPRDYLQWLKTTGKLSQADLDLFESLRVIRNSAVHSRGALSVTRIEAVEFRDLAELFIRRLRQATRSI